MTQALSARDTISVEESVHQVYKQLTEGTDIVSAPFRTMKDVFMTAACLGAQGGHRRPVEGKKVTIFRWAQFSPQDDIPLIKAMGIAEAGDVSVLLEQEQLIAIVEEFANAGIHELAEQACNANAPALWSLVALLAPSEG